MKKAIFVVTVLTLGTLAGTAATGYAAPPDPTSGATQPIREQNLDDDGLIRVHEQGVADVNVTNDLLNVSVGNETLNVSGEVEVSNFPATQDVNVVGGSITLPPVTTIAGTPATIDPIAPGEFETTDIPLMNVVSVNVAESVDEYSVSISGPLGVPLEIESNELLQETYFYTFQYPVPVDGISIFCKNESDDCFIDVTLTGFLVEG
jgi:hypothetical protein